MEFLNNDTVTNCLNDLGNSYASITMPKKKVRIEYSEDVLFLAKGLKENGYISTYTMIKQRTAFGLNKEMIQFNTKAK